MPVLGPPLVLSDIPLPPPALLPSPTERPVEALVVTLSRNGQSVVLPTVAGLGDRWLLMAGVDGLDVPATELLDLRAAGQYGSYPLGVDVLPRQVFLPVRAVFDTLTGLLAAKTILNTVTRPYGGDPLRITVQRPDAATRWIEGYRVGPGPTWGRDTWLGADGVQLFGLLVVCPDPWWRGEPAEQTWEQTATQPGFFPITPVSLAASNILGQPVEVAVSGDVATPPKWTITGPATGITAVHAETGRTWTLTPPGGLAAAEVAVVDCDPRVAGLRLTVVAPDGSSWWRYLDPPGDLWPLPPGPQTVLVTVAGADTGSRVDLAAPSLWETA